MMFDPDAAMPLASIVPASPAAQARHDKAVAEAAARSRVKILADLYLGPERGGYVAGDIVGVPADEAAHLVQAGQASYDLDAGPVKPSRACEVAGGITTVHATGIVALKILRPWASYVAGDIAGFNPELAHDLTVRGLAETVDPSPVRRTLNGIRDAILGRSR